MIVLKVGGSISRNKERLVSLCQKIDDLSFEFPFLIVPGGGAFADAVRHAARKFSLPEKVSHFMAILAMNQYGSLLHDLIRESNLSEEPEAEKNGATILLPYNFLRKNDILPHSWNVTSDSISAFVASCVKAERLVMLKDVDGIFDDDPKKNPKARLLGKVQAKDVRGCLDPYFTKFLSTKCSVISGFHPDRLEKLLRQGKIVGTEVLQ